MTGKILAITSGRADQSPLGPLIKLLQADNIDYTGIGHVRWQKYDLCLILGDRYEAIRTATTAVWNKVRIAHIHGGETTLGSFDEQFRNAISQMADIHFVSHLPAKDKLIRMFIDPEKIHVTGAPGLDRIIPFRSVPKRTKKTFLVTYHPATRRKEDPKELVKALKSFKEYEIIWTSVNNDPGCREVKYAVPNKWWADVNYLTTMRDCSLVIGNSSSGIIEAPSMEVPSVNVGDRQEARLTGPSVHSCNCEELDIIRTIEEALDYEGPYDNPYEGGGSELIAQILRSM